MIPEWFGVLVVLFLALQVVSHWAVHRLGVQRGRRRQSAVDYNRGYLRGRQSERGEGGRPQ